MDKASDGVDMETDHRLFDEILWPSLAQRVPAFEELKVYNMSDTRKLYTEMVFEDQVVVSLSRFRAAGRATTNTTHWIRMQSLGLTLSSQTMCLSMDSADTDCRFLPRWGGP